MKKFLIIFSNNLVDILMETDEKNTQEKLKNLRELKELQELREKQREWEKNGLKLGGKKLKEKCEYFFSKLIYKTLFNNYSFL